MGLFSKHKTQEDNIAPAAPAPSLNSSSNNDLGSVAPPSLDLNSPPISEVPKGSSLSAPPLPGGLNDIKEQVSSSSSPSLSEDETSNTMNNVSSEDESNFSNDSLFDMFDVGDSQEDFSGSSSSSSKSENKTSETLSYVEPTDTSMKRMDSLNFTRNSSDSERDTCFLTTSQFKALLEIVESVKSKVKNSTELHLRLMDMKSEEDIEYENMRKNFQFIEDKLYELDNILFEK